MLTALARQGRLPSSQNREEYQVVRAMHDGGGGGGTGAVAHPSEGRAHPAAQIAARGPGSILAQAPR